MAGVTESGWAVDFLRECQPQEAEGARTGLLAGAQPSERDGRRQVGQPFQEFDRQRRQAFADQALPCGEADEFLPPVGTVGEDVPLRAAAFEVPPSPPPSPRDRAARSRAPCSA